MIPSPTSTLVYALNNIEWRILLHWDLFAGKQHIYHRRECCRFLAGGDNGLVSQQIRAKLRLRKRFTTI